LKPVLKYILPAALVAGFLWSFFYEALHLRFIIDDSFFDAIIHKFGFFGSVKYCYEVANGRWFSHFISCLIFYFSGHTFSSYFFTLVLFLLLFLFAAAFLFKYFMQSFHKKSVSWISAFGSALVFTALLYFLQYEGRREIWIWISSAANHLLSVTLCLFLFGFLLKESANFLVTVFALLVAVCIGGLNEINAICSVLTMGGLFLLQQYYYPTVKINKLRLILAIVGICVSLVLNFLSAGYKIRLEGLPDFTFIQSLKNTLHSFLIPVLDTNLITLSVVALILLGVFIKIRIQQQSGVFTWQKKNTIILMAALTITSLSFFLHCFTLSDIVPPRGALWGYALTLFVLFTSFERLLPSAKHSQK